MNKLQMSDQMSMIASLSNDKIKAARKLRTNKQRQRTGLMLIEGVRLIDDAMQSGCIPEQVFFSPEATAVNRDADRLLKNMSSQAVSCTPVTAQVFASITETVTPQGIAAVVRMPRLHLPAHPDLIVILDGIADPGNAGTLLRSAEAAGADLAVFGPGAVDAFNGKVVRAGMGAHFRLPLRMCADWEQVRFTIGSHMNIYCAVADAPLTYDAIDWRESAALIIGSEATGASESARAMATGVSIPMHGPVESLNAAMAGTIILFEAARQRIGYVQASVDTRETSGV